MVFTAPSLRASTRPPDCGAAAALPSLPRESLGRMDGRRRARNFLSGQNGIWSEKREEARKNALLSFHFHPNMCSGKIAYLSPKAEIGNHPLITSYDKLLRRQATTVVLRKARHLAWQEERHGTNKGRQMGSSNFHPNCTSFPRRRARASFLLLLERRRLCLFSLQNGDGVSSAGLGRVRQTSIPNMINGAINMPMDAV